MATNHIALSIYMDLTNTHSNRTATDKMTVYTVQNGKIVQEHFLLIRKSMNIAIIRAGNIGSTLAEGFAQKGHQIFLGV